jgi:hypothetical protein
MARLDDERAQNYWLVMMNARQIMGESADDAVVCATGGQPSDDRGAIAISMLGRC